MRIGLPIGLEVIHWLRKSDSEQAVRHRQARRLATFQIARLYPKASKTPFQVGHIQPAVELKPHPLEQTDLFEPEARMELDARGILRIDRR